MPPSRRVLWQALERALFALASGVREYVRLASEEARLTTWAESKPPEHLAATQTDNTARSSSA